MLFTSLLNSMHLCMVKHIHFKVAVIKCYRVQEVLLMLIQMNPMVENTVRLKISKIMITLVVPVVAD